ncbi:MAG: biotin--[acetyl-CoA-carboxylase] ligase [Planctomycetota bacterium]
MNSTPAPLSGWRVATRAVVDSTQDAALAWWNDDPGSPLALRAERQSAGRGRRGHRWESPEGGLWVSLVRTLEGPPDPFVGFLVGVSVLESIEALVPPGASPRHGALTLKWPNDLVAGSAKWGGILSEVRRDSRGGSVLVTGIGLDLDLEPPEVADAKSTSIRFEFGESPSPAEALSRILPRFDDLRELDRVQGRAAALARVAPRISTLGRTITWFEADRAFEGRAVSLERDGALSVLLPDGSSKVLRSADVRHLRPDDDRCPSSPPPKEPPR